MRYISDVLVHNVCLDHLVSLCSSEMIKVFVHRWAASICPCSLYQAEIRIAHCCCYAMEFVWLIYLEKSFKRAEYFRNCLKNQLEQKLMENAFGWLEWLVTPFCFYQMRKFSIGAANKKKPTIRKNQWKHLLKPVESVLLNLRRQFKLLRPIELQLKVKELKKRAHAHIEEDFAWKVNCK